MSPFIGTTGCISKQRRACGSREGRAGKGGWGEGREGGKGTREKGKDRERQIKGKGECARPQQENKYRSVSSKVNYKKRKNRIKPQEA